MTPDHLVFYNDLMNKITEKQKQLLEIIYSYIKDTGYPPSFEEMRETLGVVSNQSIIDLLVKLEKQKFLRRNESSARSLTILPLGNKILGKPALIPFLGNTTAGAPMEALEIAGEWKQISPEIKEFKNDIFLLKVFGDSMINAGIESEDVVLVKEQKEFVSGDIVLANTDTGSTIKRFISEDKPPYVYLKPENPKYQNILFDENVIIKGKVISILKNGYWKPIK